MTIAATRPIEVPANAEEPMGLADLLRARTREIHTQTERHPFQGALLQGKLGVPGFVALQGQLYLVHDSFEGHLTRLRGTDPSVGAMVRDEHYRAALLESDLRALGHDPAGVVPVEATRRFLEVMRLRAADGPWFVGVLYVLEGSTNGAKFISKAISRGCGIPGPDGLRYLDPHGEHQQTRWHAFRAGLNALPLDEAGRARVVDAADEYFRYMISMMDELR